jgi:putative proteasome-type protease
VTYCLGILLPSGLVMASDSRSNAGVDQVNRVHKMAMITQAGKCVIAILSAGNLATTQAVVSRLQEAAGSGDFAHDVFTARSMFEAANILGNKLREVIAHEANFVQPYGDPSASFLLGGQIAGEAPRLFEIYSAGNFIEASDRSCFLQIGETKYGKPILDRALQFDTDPRDGVKLVLVSMDSTLRSNLTVGLPIDLLVYRRDQLTAEVKRRITEEDPYFKMIRDGWSKALRDAYRAFPRPDWFA